MSQNKKIILFFVALLFSFFIPCISSKAEGLSFTATLDGRNVTHVLSDDDYSTTVKPGAGSELVITSEEPMQGLYLEWGRVPSEWLLKENESTTTFGTHGFLHEYVPLSSSQNSVTIVSKESMTLCNIRAIPIGTDPKTIAQVWEEPQEKTDFLVFSTHADDEILFLGGVLAKYGGGEGLPVQIAYLTEFWSTEPVREHEKLDGLWEAGIRRYPVDGGFRDYYAADLDEALSKYDHDKVLSWTVSTIRRFKPLIVVTQDLNGEYGHGGHRLLARCVTEAVERSMDPSFYPASAEEYGVFDVKKTYLHLYPENTITLDVRQPLPSMGGRSALEVARDAYKKHVSQQKYWFYVTDDPKDYRASEINCSKFGLFRTTVGNDSGQNQMTENIITYEEEERLAEEKRKAEILSSEETVRASKSASIERERTERENAEKSAAALSSENKKSDGIEEGDTNASRDRRLIIIVILIIALAVIALWTAYRISRSRRRRKRKRKKRR
ncbi:MAG: PIG-L family deacetylase [Lachnospiraceae bacterium]|nr:PIG-L family deacetylase [Lachnospiraceae bacterium]